MNEPTIKEIRIGKKELENKLATEIEAFSGKYNIEISDIVHSITNVECMGGGKTSTIRLWIELKV